MVIKELIEKRQAGAEKRKKEREKLRALEESTKIKEEERLRKEKENKDAEAAILRGRQKAKGRDFKKIGVAVGRGIARVAKATLSDEKPKRKPKARKVPTRKTKRPADTKKFNGKVYNLESVHSTKALAEKTAKRLRSAKKLVRIVKTREGFFIYSRKK